MKFMLTGQFGYRHRSQFAKAFEAETHEAALTIAHKLIIEELGGEDGEYLEVDVDDDTSGLKLMVIESEVKLDAHHPELLALLAEAQANERENRASINREIDERELARLTERPKTY